jgi:hypothetical protein
MPRSKTGYIYLFKNKENIYKYGVSTDPNRRLVQINKNKDFSRTFTVLCYFSSEDRYRSETHFKWYLQEFPKGTEVISGEFFKAENEQEIVLKLYKVANFIGNWYE